MNVDEKMIKKRLRCFKYIKRRNNDDIVNKIDEIKANGKG